MGEGRGARAGFALGGKGPHNSPMASFFAFLAGLLHCYIFYMESLAWGKPRTNKAFGVSDADAAICRSFAFNQGFYNLFLALAFFIGLGLIWIAQDARGAILLHYAAASVVGAGAVLFFSAPRLRRAGFLQAAPALLYFAALLLGGR